MLVLRRRVGESLMIGDCEVEIVEIDGKRVALGVTAPTSIAVHRREVYDEIRAQRAAEERAKGGGA